MTMLTTNSLLGCPIWYQSGDTLETNGEEITWQDRDGYVYRFGHKLPDKTDVIVLMYLLLQSQKSASGQPIRVSRYRILRSCGLKINSKSYARLMDGLTRWKMVVIEFSGTLHSGKTCRLINFGVIDNWEIDEETKHLKISLSSRFVEMMSGKGLCKHLDFTEFKQLRSPVATRLYEILKESFYTGDLWEIDALDLARQISMKERYPAHIIPKITAAIARINQCKPTTFHLTIREIKRGQVSFCFQISGKNETMKGKQRKKQVNIPNAPEIKSLIELLPSDRREQTPILEAILGFQKTHGSEYVARNIHYANRRLTRNYRSCLLKALHHDQGLARSEIKTISEKSLRRSQDWEGEIRSNKETDVQQSRKDLPPDSNMRRYIQEYIDSLSLREKTDLERKAIAKLPASLREIVDQNRPGARILLTLTLEGVVGCNQNNMLPIERKSIKIMTKK